MTEEQEDYLTTLRIKKSDKDRIREVIAGATDDVRISKLIDKAGL